MSSQDQVRPYHVGNRTPGQEAADAVSAVLDQAAQHDAAQKGKRPQKVQAKWALPLGINLGVFAVYLLIAPPAWVVMNPIEAAPIEEQIDNMRLDRYELIATIGTEVVRYDSSESANEWVGSDATSKLRGES